MDPLSVGIVIPTFQEEVTLPLCLHRLQDQDPPFEVFVADGGSSDQTLAQAQACQPQLPYPLNWGMAPQRGRAAQMNWGASQTQSEILLFLHADSALPPTGLADIRIALTDPQVIGGRFQVQLDSESTALRLITWGINTRSHLTGAFTGDMGLFIRRQVFEQLGGYAPIPLMEDLDLSQRMGQWGRVVFLSSRMITSSRRWQQQGVWRTVALMQLLRLGYRVGIRPEQLARWYQNIR